MSKSILNTSISGIEPSWTTLNFFQASDGAGSAEICRLTKEDIERSTRAVEEAERKMKMAAKPPPQVSGPPMGQFSFNVPTFPGSTQESDSISSDCTMLGVHSTT